MILITDSGSTKTGWCSADQGRPVRTVVTTGINPFFRAREEIIREIRDTLLPTLKGERIDAVYFYGAGYTFPEKNQIVEETTTPCIPAPVGVYSGLTAAARALYGNRPGIACILGTGLNSCLYGGTEITEYISPLGFILGDEGSGTVLGKLLVGDCLKRQLPAPLIRKFMDQYELTPALLLERVYKQPLPNRFLATLSRFLLGNITEQSIYNLVYTSFRNFFLRNVVLYPGADTHPIHFVGSIAYYYQEVLKAAAPSLDLEVDTVVRAPMDGLIRCHFTNEEKSEWVTAFQKITKSESLYDNLGQASVRGLLEGINNENRKMAVAVGREIPKIERPITRIIERMRRSGRLFYIGASTSGRLGVLSVSEIPPTYGMPNILVIGLAAGSDRVLRSPIESAEDDLGKAWEELQRYHINTNDTLVGIATSGTTPYVIDALRKARSKGILTVSVSCNPDSSMTTKAEIAIEPMVGPEFITGSTRVKSDAAQKMALSMITTSAMIKLDRVERDRMVNMQLTNQELVGRDTRMIMEELRLDYERDKNLLPLHGSVRGAIDSYHREWRLDQ